MHKSITSGNVYDILPLIHEYDCNRLLKRCEEILLKEPVYLKLYSIAHTYGFKEVYRQLLQKIKNGKKYLRLKEQEVKTYKSLANEAKIDFLEAMLKVHSLSEHQIQMYRYVLLVF